MSRPCVNGFCSNGLRAISPGLIRNPLAAWQKVGYMRDAIANSFELHYGEDSCRNLQ